MSDKKHRGKKEKKERRPVALPFEEAYERGNYAQAHRLARQALGGSEEAAARDVLGRVRIDPVALLTFGGCLLFFTLVALLGLL
ncbi:MAG: hypothetical protein JXR83_01110 [Deltaproteobacteria bacterium]|nr:hypothetical protein [Deltaproteobacteria bacterium]